MMLMVVVMTGGRIGVETLGILHAQANLYRATPIVYSILKGMGYSAPPLCQNLTSSGKRKFQASLAEPRQKHSLVMHRPHL